MIDYDALQLLAKVVVIANIALEYFTTERETKHHPKAMAVASAAAGAAMAVPVLTQLKLSEVGHFATHLAKCIVTSKHLNKIFLCMCVYKISTYSYNGALLRRFDGFVIFQKRLIIYRFLQDNLVTSV